MKKYLCLALVVLASTALSGGRAVAENFFSPGAPHFTHQMVAGKTMVSSGYPTGTMTFHSNGTLTCTNYPAFVGCKNWRVLSDGTLRRDFTDSHTGQLVEVQAFWKLVSRSDNTLQVQQTSNNSNGVTSVTVTIQ